MTPDLFVAHFVALAPFDWVPEACAHVGQAMEDDSAHDPGHLLRVLRHAQAICLCEVEQAPDWEVLAAAVLFHDVVNLPKNHPERREASRLSADVARKFFAGRGWPEARLSVLWDAVASHSFSSGRIPQGIEGMILCDADRMESIGAIGLARTFAVSGALGRTLFDSRDPLARERPLDEGRFGLDHVFVKCLKLREQMFTESGRQRALQAHQLMEMFVQALGREVWPAEP